MRDDKGGGGGLEAQELKRVGGDKLEGRRDGGPAERPAAVCLSDDDDE